ncbi:MFS transporter [Pectobacteriaceae bacterium CE90]|nr:MFS transporter [Pectobacteriaceae bacterium CE90]
MSTTLDPKTTNEQPSLSGRPEQMATRLVFFITGITISAWAPLIPFAKARLGINDASLGALLLTLGVGSLLAMLLAGFLTSRFSCRRVIQIATICTCLILPALTQADTILEMAVVLFLFGFALGLIDVSINIQAVVVEQVSGHAMMSGFHGFYSVGGIAGAGGLSACLWLGLSPFFATLVVVTLTLLLLLGSQRHLLRSKSTQNKGPLLVCPRGRVLIIGILCFIMFLTEGAILDWGALYLTTARGFDNSWAGTGYVAFSITMTVGRLNGDRIVNALGRYAVVAGGSLCAALGLLLSISINHPATTIIGFMMVGIGASNVVPILFTAAGNQKTMSTNMAIASISILGYIGILAGPTLLGFISQWSNLSLALGVVVLLLLIVSASARTVTRPSGA